VVNVPAFAIDPSRQLSADQNPNDWLTNHGSYKSYHYSPADQINIGNVKNLEVAWTHFPERATRGIQSTPLAADGVLYYSGSYSRVYALEGATGKVQWSFAPELDEELIAKQTHSPYNRGLALGNGNVYVGTVDGRLIAVDMKTGKPVWDTRLVDSKKLPLRGGFHFPTVQCSLSDRHTPSWLSARWMLSLHRDTALSMHLAHCEWRTRSEEASVLPLIKNTILRERISRSISQKKCGESF
jgi:hypothetical protein